MPRTPSPAPLRRPPAAPAAARAKTAAPLARARTNSTGEQIAKQLGQDILQGLFVPGQRIGEQAVGERFALSRGPVRDALRILERQGLVEVRPRRGAFVVELALDDVADVFNVRAALLSLAVRYLARNPDKSALSEVDPALAQLRRLAQQKRPSLPDFAQATGRVAMRLLAACASDKVIQATYRGLPHDALWRMLWVTPQPPDYARPERRAETFGDYEQLLATVRAGQADAAEALMRKIMTDTRDEVLHALSRSHTDTVAPFRL